MRIALALLIWIVFVGGLGFYMHHRDVSALTSRPDVETQAAKGHYAMEITTTFAVEPDPFALKLDSEEKQPALLVRLVDQEILRVNDRLEAGTPIRLEPLSGLVEGLNEIYLEASPPLEQTGKSHAVRVKILRDGQTVAEETFWSQPGGKVADTMGFELLASQAMESDHGHE